MTTYICPMHSDIRSPGAGNCPYCNMPLIAEGSNFAILQHMLSSPRHIAIMVGLMLLLMAAAMAMMN